MHAFDVLGDPVRRRILELLNTAQADRGTHAAASGISAGELAQQIRAEFSISQPAVSQHLKVLRENGFATVSKQAQRRLYALDPTGLQAVDAWLARYRRLWTQRLDALDTELRRGRRDRHTDQPNGTTP